LLGQDWRSGEGGKIAIDPSNSKIIYIGGVSDSGKVLIVLKSANGGQSWTKKTFDSGYFSAWATGIAVSPKNPATLYFCGYFYDKNVHARARVYRSTNAGGSWRDITPGNLNPNQALALGISIDPRNPARVFAALDDRVVRSEDSGASWQAQTTPSSIYPNCLTLDQTNLNTLYAGGNRINYKSVDGGKTWSSSASGLLGIASKILAAGNTVHWGSSAGIFKSLNGGASFKTSQAGIKAFQVCSLSIPASASSTIYAAAENCAVFKTSNRGRSWTKLPDFPVNVDIADLAASDSDPKRVYVSTYG
jgi:photosystem II stability/assembly factor-like uncharacterized protein